MTPPTSLRVRFAVARGWKVEPIPEWSHPAWFVTDPTGKSIGILNENGQLQAVLFAKTAKRTPSMTKPMTPNIEQAAMDCYYEVEKFNNPSKRLAIIAKHMEGFAFVKEQNRELLKDKERLDWLGNHKSVGVAFELIFNSRTRSKELVPTWSVHKTNPEHLRQAIDAALDALGEHIR